MFSDFESLEFQWSGKKKRERIMLFPQSLHVRPGKEQESTVVQEGPELKWPTFLHVQKLSVRIGIGTQL